MNGPDPANEALKVAVELLDQLEREGYACVHQWWPTKALRSGGNIGRAMVTAVAGQTDYEIVEWTCAKCGAKRGALGTNGDVE